MKKVLFSFVVAAVAAVMVSCGNKSAQNAEAQEGEATEQAAEATEEKAEEQKEVPIDQLTELSSDKYTAKVPDGWKARSRMVNNSCVMGLKQPPFTGASLNIIGYKTPEQYKADTEKNGNKEVGKETISGKEFTIFEGESKDGRLQKIAITPLGEDLFVASLQTGAHKLSKEEAKAAIDANLKTVLENITIK